MPMLELWDPWQEFDRLRGEVDRLFGRFAPTGQAGADAMLRPMTRVREAEDALHLTIDLPGVSADDMEIEAQGRFLRIRGERRGDVQLRYERTLTLPESADPTDIEARHANGVLELRVAKRREALPRRVEIMPGDVDAAPQIEAGERETSGAPA
jgi:HSP20 family protein